MDKQRITDLHDKYLKQVLSEKEQLQWKQVLVDPEAEAFLKELIFSSWDSLGSNDRIELNGNRAEEIFEKISRMSQPANQRVVHWLRYVAAASVILIMSLGIYFFSDHKGAGADEPQSLIVNDIKPGGNNAVLTLANGKQITLTGANNGALAVQGTTAITKSAEGQVIYKSDDQNAALSEVSYNTIATPAGGKWQVSLPDGTRVWLDALSSIRFPTAFSGKDRQVEVKGQVYLEVAHDARKPFRVRSKGQIIEVLGTRFNVNAYEDEPDTKTTLLEGSIRLNHGTLLKPGDQAANNGKGISITKVDVDGVIGWKEDDFVFSGDTFDQAMRKIARWYDVQLIYDHVDTSDILPFGLISRTNKLSVVLKSMESAGNVHFKVEGRRITITQ